MERGEGTLNVNSAKEARGCGRRKKRRSNGEDRRSRLYTCIVRTESGGWGKEKQINEGKVFRNKKQEEKIVTAD